MLYTYDKKQLKFKRVTWLTKIIALILIGVMILLLSSSMSETVVETKYISEETKTVVLAEYNEFSEDKLDEYIAEINIKFPHIVKAQATLETGYFQSEVFRVNHNLFGMKQASLRPTTALGTNLGHAYYDNWRQSVLDYAFYQAAYLRDIKTEEQYFDYLKANYAEDPNYIDKLKIIVGK